MTQPVNTVNKILKALFDIKPVDGAGRVDLEKITKVMPVVNLANQKPAGNAGFGGHTRIRDSGSSTINKYSRLANQVKSDVYRSDSLDLAGVEPARPWLTSRVSYPSRPKVKQSYQLNSNKKQNPILLLEKYLNSNLNIRREVRNIGGKTIVNKKTGKPRIRPIILNSKLETLNSRQTQNSKFEIQNTDDYDVILSQINQKPAPALEVELVGEPRRIEPFESLTQRASLRNAKMPFVFDVKASAEIESWVRYAKTQKNPKFKIFPSFKKVKDIELKLPMLDLVRSRFNLKKLSAVAVLGFFALIFTSFGQYGVSVKNEVLKESNLAVANLEQANENLRVFDFEAASNNFAEAYEEFSKAGESLNFMGAELTSLFAELPGAGKLKSAKNLVEAGKLLAEAGRSMSEAVNSLSQTGSILELATSDVRGTSDVRNIFGGLRKSLMVSGKNLSKAKALLADVNADILPEEKREAFLEFQSKLPELEDIVSDAVGYTNFLERFLGFGLATSTEILGAASHAPETSPRNGRGTSDVRYLVLFQNNSELRPTGGFSGTYAVVTFKDGRLSDFLVDDVYNLDGQLKENIIPPKPLQHITPSWGMRDASWFIDFSISAQKAMEFFKKEAGYEIDGVITMSPRMISDILKVVGPIEMPEYGYAINDENFLSTIQAEVEYGDNREQPKSVVMDMAPLLLERIYSSDPGQWLDIFNVFVSGLDKKDMLMYFKDLNLEQFAADRGFGGLVQKTSEDYLMVTFTNVKGSKTDRVIDNSISINSKFETLNSKPVIRHKLTITRQHNGGNTKYGFYNRQNPAYVRVLVPEEAELLSISGNSNPEYKPLLDYSDSDFIRDDDLFRMEGSFNFNDENGVSTYKESGKTGFAFWLVTDPGKQKTVELEYVVPLTTSDVEPTSDVQTYGIYIQKQPGLEVDNFEFKVGDIYIYNGELDKDLELRFKAE